MTRLIPPILTAAAVWSLGLAEGHADTHAGLTANDPTCTALIEDAAPSGEAAPAPGCPEPATGASS